MNRNRIVVELSNTRREDGAAAVLTLALSEPADLDGFGVPFTCPADDDSFVALASGQLGKDGVRVAGQRLYLAVGEHERIGQKLNEALGANLGERAPVFVKLRTAGHAEELPWETLCSPRGNFLGLDERWSLARIVEPTRRGAPLFEMTPPIRIVAVLSCLDVPAFGELTALRDAISGSGMANDTELLVFASEDDIYDAIMQERASTRPPPEIFDVRFVPTDLDELCDDIKAFKPHILHFFCHGSKSDASIEVATKRSWHTNPVRGLLSVGARQFEGFRASKADVPWLITLNCCESAGVDTSTINSRSLALDLVYCGLAPAVIGMREAITPSSANVFTKRFYRQLLNDLADPLTRGARCADVDWARIIATAREAVALRSCSSLAEASRSTKQWTMPVLYVRPQEFVTQLNRQDFGSRVDRKELEAILNLGMALPPGEGGDLWAGIEAAVNELVRRLSSDPGPD
jgi:hypothetical protein